MYNIFKGKNIFNIVDIKPQNIVLLTMGNTIKFDNRDIAETLPKNITDIGSVNRIHVNVVKTLSFRNFDFTFSKHLGKKISPVTEANEKRNPTSCIKKGFNNINTVIQSIKVAPLLLSLPKNRAKSETVVIVDALTKEDDTPENIENPHIQSILESVTPFPTPFFVIRSTPCATSATLYPEAAIICDTPELLSALLKSF